MKKFIGFSWTGYRLWITLFCLGILPFVQGTSARAQGKFTSEFYPLESTPAEGEQPLEGPLHPLLREQLPVEGQPLEGPIDPRTYQLGPGDLLAVHVMGKVDREFLSRVSADGTLRFATLGIFNAGSRFFEDLKQEILEVAKSRYRTGEIVVYLVELRSFKASVGGMVWAPGTYTLTATDRAVALLSRAGGFYNPTRREESAQLSQLKTVLERERKEQIIPELPSYSARRAQIIHRDGSRESVDLLLFLRAGKPEGNPYLQDGDFLLVPPLNPKSGVIGVYGAVNHQGMIEYLQGDDLGRALLLAGNLTLEANRDSIEITRFTGEKGDYITFVVNLNDSGNLATPLHPDDRIYIRSKPRFHPRHQVELRGEVMKPGFYPVQETGTPLLEIIEKAGGFTSRASLEEATLIRRFGLELVDPEYERLRQTPVADMKPLEYQYFKTKSREIKGKVVVDFYDLFVEADSTQNILLHDGDLLEVPPFTRTVKITGQVNQPGIVNYEAGEPYTYYIAQSGGYSWNARRSKTRIIKTISGTWVKPGHTMIEEGDTIFVPEKPEVDYWLLYKDIILVLTQFATIYLVITAASK